MFQVWPGGGRQMRWNHLAGIRVADSVIIIDILRRSQVGEKLTITVETMLITQNNNNV